MISSLTAAWALVIESGLYLLFGFALAGLIHAFVPVSKVSSWLGSGRWRSVVNASLIGTPLPLCSCSVVPVAAALRKSGASKGATTAFLISTPESGVDSIAVTYALLDPVMAIARPVTAFLTATIAGIVQNTFEGSQVGDANDQAIEHKQSRDREGAESSSRRSPLPDGRGSKGASGHGCGCSSECEDTTLDQSGSLVRRLGAGLRFGLIDLFEDLAVYLLGGFILAGVLAVVLERFELGSALGSAWAPLIMLAVGVPMYVCASSATPLVAVLISAGLSPGAGLVFLLAGPATNAATLVLLNKILGVRATLVYVVSIMVCALAGGYAVDLFYGEAGITPRALTGMVHDCAASPLSVAAGLLLCGLILNGLRLRYWPVKAPNPVAIQA